jgi:hypothetical protein
MIQKILRIEFKVNSDFKTDWTIKIRKGLTKHTLSGLMERYTKTFVGFSGENSCINLIRCIQANLIASFKIFKLF